MFFSRKITGDLGEKAAVQELKRQGYEILEQNYRVRNGEIDIIATDNGVLAIVEVKTRSSNKFGLPEEAVDQRKVRHMLNAINVYLSQKRLHDMPVRIDVVSVLVTDNDELTVDIIRNAVEVDE